MEKRLCPECNETITGRTDKKFCSDLCRNSFNNRQNSDATNLVRNINNALRRNRRILEELLQGGPTRILAKQKLSVKGFDFLHHTSLLNTQSHTYFFTYEYGYRNESNEQVMIVKKKFENT